jgi:hypothetical protein
MTRAENPFKDARRESSFPNLWYAVVPETLDARGRVVVCSYSVHETEHMITCGSWSVLGWPV